MGGGKAVWPCRTVTPAASTAFLVHSLLTLPNPLVVLCCSAQSKRWAAPTGFHKLEKIRHYRQACEQGKLGELDPPAPFFNWFHDEELINAHAKRVPMKQVRVVGRVVSLVVHQPSASSSGRFRGVVESIAALGPGQHVGPVACARLPPLPARRPVPRYASRPLPLPCDELPHH